MKDKKEIEKLISDWLSHYDKGEIDKELLMSLIISLIAERGK